MSKPFKNLVDKMSPERQTRVRERTLELLYEMELSELRKALALTQTQLAETLKKKQASISKMEHQSDMFISTLREILNAMGANLKIIASFPEGDILINQFEEIRTGKPEKIEPAKA
jgi:transcriptional regulator with XRE-family HTH domain